MISDLYIGGLPRRPVMSVDVPVMLATAQSSTTCPSAMFPERQTEILRQQHLPAGWIAGLIDSTGTIIARSQNAARYVGQKGSPTLLKAISQAQSGITAGQTLDGIQVSTAWARSDLSGWTVAVGVPTADFTNRLWRFLALSLVCTLALIAANFAVAAASADAWCCAPSSTPRRVSLKMPRRKSPRSEQLLRLSQPRAPLAVDGGARQLGDYRNPLPRCETAGPLRAHRPERGPHQRYLEQILSYARYEAGELTLCKEPLDVADELRSSLNLLEGTANQAGVMLLCHVEPQMPPLNADRTQLRQIMLNLLSNAIKFTPRGGMVTISASQVGSDCVIRVEDTGTGISAEDLPRVTQPFAQVRRRADRRARRHRPRPAVEQGARGKARGINDAGKCARRRHNRDNIPSEQHGLLSETCPDHGPER